MAATRPAFAAEPATRPALHVTEVRRIWTAPKPSAAFTDLIHYKGEFLCTFREGMSHASPDGTIRVLASRDGGEWQSIAELTSDDYDLRDPKFSVMPDGRLMLNGGATSYTPRVQGKADTERQIIARHSFVSFSPDGRTWTAPKVVTKTEEDLWIWRVTWHKGVAYGVGKKRADSATLVTSPDGIDFKRHTPPLLTEQFPNEATLRFTTDDKAYCIIRREGEKNADGKYSRANAFFGVSDPPYDKWTWQDTGFYLGGPNLFQLPDGRWIIGARTRNGPAQMSLLQLNIETGKTELLTNLPSGGDCSYPGMVWKDDLLWVSYYSSHEGHTAIYLAKVAMQALKE